MGSVDFLDRFKGALLGCAIGDAAGAAIERSAKEAFREIIEEGSLTAALREESFEITHNTQMMVVMAQSLVETGRFSLPHTAFKFGRYIEYSDMGVKEAVGIDDVCAEACRTIYRERKYEKIALPGEGICPAVRAVPVALRYFEKENEMLEHTIAQAEITHCDTASTGAALAVAQTISICLGEKNQIKPDRLVKSVADFVEENDPYLSRLLNHLLNEEFFNPDMGALNKKSKNSDESEEMKGVHRTFISALSSFVRFPPDFEKCLIETMKAGKELSGCGAIAGAIAGAYCGKSNIPSSFVKKMRGSDYIEGLAIKLFTLTPASAAQPRSFL